MDYRMVIDPNELREYAAKCREAEAHGFDYETTGLDVYTNKICGFSLAADAYEGIYVPVYHDFGDLMDPEVAQEIMVEHYHQCDNCVAHNAGFEWMWAWVKWGVKIQFKSDSSVLGHLDDPNRAHRFDPRSLKLKMLAREVFGYEVIDLKDLIDVKSQNLSMLPGRNVKDYGSQDSDLALQFHNLWYGDAIKYQPTIFRLEMSLIEVNAEMTLRGIKQNPDLFSEGGKRLTRELAELERKTFHLMGFNQVVIDANGEVQGKPFELNSNKRVSEHFFGQMGIPPQDRPSKSGQHSISKKVISGLRHQYEVVDAYLDWSEAFTMNNNFVERLPDYINPVTGFVHGSFNSQGAPTGRYSHSQPNLAQLPKQRD